MLITEEGLVALGLGFGVTGAEEEALGVVAADAASCCCSVEKLPEVGRFGEGEEESKMLNFKDLNVEERFIPVEGASFVLFSFFPLFSGRKNDRNGGSGAEGHYGWRSNSDRLSDNSRLNFKRTSFTTQ